MPNRLYSRAHFERETFKIIAYINRNFLVIPWLSRRYGTSLNLYLVEAGGFEYLA